MLVSLLSRQFRWIRSRKKRFFSSHLARHCITKDVGLYRRGRRSRSRSERSLLAANTPVPRYRVVMKKKKKEINNINVSSEAFFSAEVTWSERHFVVFIHYLPVRRPRDPLIQSNRSIAAAEPIQTTTQNMLKTSYFIRLQWTEAEHLYLINRYIEDLYTRVSLITTKLICIINRYVVIKVM